MAKYESNALLKFEDETFDFEDLDIVYQGEEENVAPGERVSGEDGFILTINNNIFPDLYYWSEITGLSIDEIIEEYSGRRIWLDPEQYLETKDITRGWLTRDQYLTGNLERKLKLAVKANELSGLFEDNISLLKENLPVKPGTDEIRASLGAAWIPDWIYEKFVRKLLDLNFNPTVVTAEVLGKRKLTVNEQPPYIRNKKTYGTEDMDCVSIINHILNSVPLKAYDYYDKPDGNGKEAVVNKERTLYLNEKANRIKEEWQNFIRNDEEVSKAIWEAFSDTFGYNVCHFDGSYLELPGMNEDIELYSYQRNAIAHGLSKKNLLLSHSVGSGKTWVYSAIAYECVRLGLSKRVLFVVPNNTLEQAYEAFLTLYPGARVDTFLITPKKEFAKAVRQDTLKRISEGEASFIFMAYSSFDMLKMSRSYQLNKLDDEAAVLRHEISESKSRTLTKMLQTQLDKVEKKLEKLEEKYEDDTDICFDSLGVDFICVDEAHNYKNISINFNYDNIVGLNKKGSKKADDLMDKVVFVRERGGRIVMATGTPLTNSLSDLYVFQRYLQSDDMKLSKIFHFNDWVNAFAEPVTEFAVDVDSVHGKFQTRFSRFHNLPELMAIGSEIIDFHQTKVGDDEDITLPRFEGYSDILIKKTKSQTAYMDNIVKRTEAIRLRKVTRDEDNLLLITIQGRMAAVDTRLLQNDLRDISSEDKLGGRKIQACAKEMAEVYYKYPGTTQIAFSDIGTPKEDFNVYDELKKELIKRGVKEEDVKYIHEADTEAKRAKIEADFNKGKLRILIGSTMKLGTGTNVQDRLIAIHHLDVPWKPADMVQREGRIIRQGNMNEKVFIYRYITEKSFDAYSYQILQVKQRFISQFLMGHVGEVGRSEAEIGDAVLNYAEIKALALGNGSVKERIETEILLSKARTNQIKKAEELLKLSEEVEEIPDKINKLRFRKNRAVSDGNFYRRNRRQLDKLTRYRLGAEAIRMMRESDHLEYNKYVMIYMGFRIFIPISMRVEAPYLIVNSHAGSIYNVDMKDVWDKPMGVCMRIDNLLNSLSDLPGEIESDIARLYAELEHAKTVLAQGNPYDNVVIELHQKLEELDKRSQYEM